MTSQRVQTAKSWLISTVFVCFAVVFSACSRPNPTPEVLDPIYADLVQRSGIAKAAAESAKGEIKKISEEIEALPPRDNTRRKLLADRSKKETQMMVADQEGLYYEIRAEQRKQYARNEYLNAYDKGKPWPDPKDFETYKLQRKLQEAPREWSSKVEKTGRYNRKSPEEMRKELDDKLKAAGPAPGH